MKTLSFRDEAYLSNMIGVSMRACPIAHSCAPLMNSRLLFGQLSAVGMQAEVP